MNKQYVFKGVIIVILAIFSFSFLAQKTKLKLHGTVTNLFTTESMGVVKVVLYRDSTKYKVFITPSDGKYVFDVDLGHVYVVDFVKKGMVSKHVEVDALNIAVEDTVYGYNMTMDMTLFERIDDIDFSKVEDFSVGKAKYDYPSGDIIWDVEYSIGYKEDIKPIMEEVAKKRKKWLKKQAKQDVSTK